MKLILVSGGSRSGKSVWAEKLVRAQGGKTAYIATALVEDEEMARRVAGHQKRRSPDEWGNYEAPQGAAACLREAGGGAYNAVLFDCLTVYTGNRLFALAGLTPAQKEAALLAETDEMIAAARESACPVVFVTSEVGSGIVPMDPVAREFRDVVGLINQKMAAAADEVWLVACGLAIDLKRYGEAVEME